MSGQFYSSQVAVNVHNLKRNLQTGRIIYAGVHTVYFVCFVYVTFIGDCHHLAL